MPKNVKKGQAKKRRPSKRLSIKKEKVSPEFGAGKLGVRERIARRERRRERERER